VVVPTWDRKVPGAAKKLQHRVSLAPLFGSVYGSCAKLRVLFYVNMICYIICTVLRDRCQAYCLIVLCSVLTAIVIRHYYYHCKA